MGLLYGIVHGDDNSFGHAFGGDAERTTWDFSKSVKDNTFLK